MQSETAIKFTNFSFKYLNLDQVTLSNINLIINEGEKVLITGKSGSGKSTLGHCINGLIPFTYKGDITGKLEVLGKEPNNLSIFEAGKMVGTILDVFFLLISIGILFFLY